METLQKQILLFGEDELMSLQEDFHANHTVRQGKDSVKKMSAIYGQRCLEQFEKYPRVGLWAKTFAGLLIGMEGWYSMRCKLTWKLSATKSHRFYFQLVASMPRTKEIESGSWLLKTPTKMDGEVTSGKSNPIPGNSGTLAQEIMSNYSPTMEKLYPTPQTQGLKVCKERRSVMIDLNLLPTPTGGNGMQSVLKHAPNNKIKGRLEYKIADLMLPTPMASDCGEKVTGLETQNSLTKIARELTGQTSLLNPLFVLEMMGFPPDWTELPFLSGDKSR